MGGSINIISPAVPAPSTSAALISVAELQAMPGLDAANYTSAQLTSAIAQAQSLIESYCDRALMQASYHEWLDSEGGQTIRLRNWPVTVSRLSSTYGAVATISTSTACDSVDVSIGAGLMTVTINGGASAGAYSYTLASHATLAALRTAVNVAPLVMEVSVEAAPASLRPGVYGGWNQGGLIYLLGPWQDATAYVVQPETGVLRTSGWPCGAGSVYCHYTAGYATAPADLKMVCAQVAMASMEQSAGMVTSEKIGNVQTNYAGPGANGLLTAHVSVLNRYRRLM